jgi:hypothetical protein
MRTRRPGPLQGFAITLSIRIGHPPRTCPKRRDHAERREDPHGFRNPIEELWFSQRREPLRDLNGATGGAPE